ncbi:hypothetical protein SAMN04487971_11294 [Paracoccus chinensis]|uniref:PPC domain-containing protein n=2 Tax=Paracoccus chinensis TaxID=525640 RepID=A0A1G9KVN3_9RHOB|nr:DUF296 domain-containing protein [Paracoccus chinensis]SDL53920.1 hypothetical protein SAMN04487971_11294 [Paracoccus chinensis]
MHSGGVFAAVRLLPGDELIAGLRCLQPDTGNEAMTVVTCAGRLRSANIGHADVNCGRLYEGRSEIVSLAGTMDRHHRHLHISNVDTEGEVFGAHLLPGSAVCTTAGIVALILPDLSFGRAPCDRSGFDERTITKRKAEA